MKSNNAEEFIYKMVDAGEFEIDENGAIWRVAERLPFTGMSRYGLERRTVKRKRAENSTGRYLQVRSMIDGHRRCALAHRLVWRHHNGAIPEGMTVNHKNGNKTDNRIDNLELATQKQQIHHALYVLGVGAVTLFGERHPYAKMSDVRFDELEQRAISGEDRKSLSKEFGVAETYIWHVVNGQARCCQRKRKLHNEKYLQTLSRSDSEMVPSTQGDGIR